MPKLNPTPNVDCRYGAPMGRSSSNVFTDKRGANYEFTVNENAAPFRLVRVRLNSGGYDSGGAYWGLGAPLYYFEGPLTNINGWVRGRTREHAKTEVRALHPLARFYR